MLDFIPALNLVAHRGGAERVGLRPRPLAGQLIEMEQRVLDFVPALGLVPS